MEAVAGFEQLLRPAVWADVMDVDDAAQLALLIAAIVFTVGGNAADFNRRITKRLFGFPYLLFIMIKRPANMYCAWRKGVACMLLAADTLDDTSQKIKQIFGHALR